ncbi:MAG: NAD(P)H-dependent oxidoreductase subunit E [Thermodesulfobacteriota bacterium]
MDAETVEKLEKIYQRYLASEGNCISVLQDIQAEFGYLPRETVRWFSKRSGIPESRFFGIATFYTQFHLKPRGKNIITACCGTVCHVKGGHRVIARIHDELKLKEGQETTRDKLFTLEKVNCIGACSIAPVVVINKKVGGMMTPGKIARELKQYRGKDSE